MKDLDEEKSKNEQFDFEDDFIGISKNKKTQEKKKEHSILKERKKNNSKKNINKIYLKNREKNKKEKLKKEIDYENTEHFKFKSPYEDAINKRTTQRIVEQERKRQAKIRRARIIFTSIIAILLFIIIMLSPIFNVSEIIVENNNKISKDSIISNSGIKLNKNMFLFNKYSISERILKAEPYAESVIIKRKLPNKVRIIVTERVPVAQIKLSDNSYAYIDNQGFILEFSNEKLKIPEIKGEKTDLADLKTKEGVQRLNENDLSELGLVLKVISIMKDNGMDSYIVSFDITDKKDLKMQLNQNNKKVYLGDCSSLNTRILYLKKILEDTKGEKGEIFINGNLKDDHMYFRKEI